MSTFDSERLRWIETWAQGWRKYMGAKRVLLADPAYYAQLPLDVAVGMIEEATKALRDPDWALRLLAEELHETGAEIGEVIERIRYEGSANAAEAGQA